MSTATQALDRMLDPVRDILTPQVAEGLVNLRADAATQSRLDDLAARNTGGQLTADERSEYETLVAAGNVIAVLQAKARAVLRGR
jgi:hypothetical protein